MSEVDPAGEKAVGSVVTEAVDISDRQVEPVPGNTAGVGQPTFIFSSNDPSGSTESAGRQTDSLATADDIPDLRADASQALIAATAKITPISKRVTVILDLNTMDDEEFGLECRKANNKVLIDALGIGVGQGPVISTRDNHPEPKRSTATKSVPSAPPRRLGRLANVTEFNTEPITETERRDSLHPPPSIPPASWPPSVPPASPLTSPPASRHLSVPPPPSPTGGVAAAAPIAPTRDINWTPSQQALIADGTTGGDVSWSPCSGLSLAASNAILPASGDAVDTAGWPNWMKMLHGKFVDDTWVSDSAKGVWAEIVQDWVSLEKYTEFFSLVHTTYILWCGI